MPGILSIHGRIQFVRTVWYQKILQNSVKTVETVDFRGTQLKSAETVDYSGFSVDFKQCQSIFGNISRLEFNKICMPLISIVTVYNKLAGISSISNKRIKYTFISTAYNRLITFIIIMISKYITSFSSFVPKLENYKLLKRVIRFQLRIIC